MKVLSIYLSIISSYLFCACNNSSRVEFQITNCPKQISYLGIDLKDSLFTSYELYHDGFCYTNIDTIRILKEFISGSQQVYLKDSIDLASKDIDFHESSPDHAKISMKLREKSDTAFSISSQIKSIYHNGTESNTISFSYQLPCKKKINSPRTDLVDTMSCNTSAGVGDRYLVTFGHEGYCIPEIDSIAGTGTFYSDNGFLWNSSSFLVPRERVTFQANNYYLQEISFKLCVTNSYSDYVDTYFYVVYKDGSKSNLSRFKILFYKLEKKLFKGIHAKVGIK
jgi:hypothetical protein